MKRETQGPELGEYGFELTLHIRHREPWPNALVARARETPGIDPEASDLDAVAAMLVCACGFEIGRITGKPVYDLTEYPVRPDRK